MQGALVSRKHRKPQQDAQSVKPEPKRNVPKHRQCPACYGGRGGVGKERWHTRKGAVMRVCFQCIVCGFDWIANLKTVSQPVSVEWTEAEVEHLDVNIDGER